MTYIQFMETFCDLQVGVFISQPPVLSKFLMVSSNNFSCDSCCVYLVSLLDIYVAYNLNVI